jgi:DNA-binding transcriptional MerR regulator
LDILHRKRDNESQFDKANGLPFLDVGGEKLMSRSADYTIQGFIYQFNKTILAILNAKPDEQIAIEGVVEDIDVVSPTGITAIQCKYHESQDHFQLSTLYKPILQMLSHFVRNHEENITYRIFCHFQDTELIGKTRGISKMELSEVLSTSNQKLKPLVDLLKENPLTSSFIPHFEIEFGPNMNGITKEVIQALKNSGFPTHEIDELIYPNAVHLTANYSTEHEAELRKTTKNGFIQMLKTIRTSAISKWTLALKQAKKLLAARRKQLKTNLAKNVRSRYFVISKSGVDDFIPNIVLLMTDFVSKYHFKIAHKETPVFSFDCAPEELKDIQFRLFKKAVISCDGIVGGHFDVSHFFREPVVQKTSPGELKREFQIRILPLTGNESILRDKKPDDLFLLGEGDFQFKDLLDVNIEQIGTRKFSEIRYLLGVNDAQE